MLVVNYKKLILGRVETGAVIGTILIVLFFVIGTDGLWLTSIPSVLRLTVQIGIIAVGQALLMTAGEIDLSVGSIFAFVGVVFVWMMDELALAPVVAMFLALSTSFVIGFLNGVITVMFKVPAMIVTLGAMFIYRGLTYISTKGVGLSIPRELRNHPVIELLEGKVSGLNNTILILLVVVAFFVFVLAKTRFGSHVLAVGGDAASALANGISPGSVKIRAFVICSGLAGLSGVLVVGQEGSVYSTSGVQLELDTIAAAVIGGCTLRGGIGSIWGAVLGVFVLSSLKSGLLIMGAPTSWYVAFVGAILIGFLMLSKFTSSRLGAAI